MGGGQTQTQNSTQVATKTPYAPAIPGLQQSLTDANTLYQSGIGGQVYQGQRVADFNDDTNMGINRTRDTALSDDAGSIGVNYLQSVLGSNGGVTYNGPQLDGNGLSAGTVGALGQLQGVQGVSTAGLQGLQGQLSDPNSGVNRTASDFMSGANDIRTGGLYNALFGANAQPTASQRNLQSQADGSQIDPTTNPIFQKLVQTSADNALQAQKEAFAASGRYGSGAFAGAANKAVNDTQSQLYAAQYNQGLQNQLAANQQIDSANQSQIGLGNTIANSLTNLGSLNNQQKLAGAGVAQAQTAQQAGVLGQILGGDEFNSSLDLSKAQGALGAYQQGTANAMQNEQARVSTALQSQGQGLQAASMLPSISALRYQGGQALQGIGAAQQQQYQSGLDAAQDYFNETQQKPWQLLGQYASYPLAIGSQGGTTVSQGTSQTHTSGPSALQTALGLGTGLLSLGTGGGASVGGGLLSSLFASDERLKDDVREVGQLHDGQPVYSYRYKGDDRTQIGLIAQEVAKTKPEAVGNLGIGDFLGVDYGKATDRAAEMASGGGASSTPAPSDGRSPGLMALMTGGDPSRPRPGTPAGLGHMLRALAPQEPAPIPREKPKAAPSRRKAA